MKKLYSIPIFLILLFFLAFSVTLAHGEEATKSSNPLKDLQDKMKSVVAEKKDTLKDLRASKTAEIKTIREDLKASMSAAMKERKAMLESEMKARREETKMKFRDQVEAKKAELKTQIETKRAEFKAKLVALRDEKKKAILDRLDNNINAINKRRTDEMVKNLDRQAALLDKINNRAAKVAANGTDVSSVDAAVSAARTQINTAQGVVSNQAAKQYVMALTSEEALGQAVSTTKQGLFADLRAAHESVQSARSLVEAAFKALGSLPGVENGQ